MDRIVELMAELDQLDTEVTARLTAFEQTMTGLVRVSFEALFQDGVIRWAKVSGTWRVVLVSQDQVTPATSAPRHVRLEVLRHGLTILLDAVEPALAAQVEQRQMALAGCDEVTKRMAKLKGA